ncbi:hypothetical protein HY025_03960 [Candidatus Daviesbacteria bacterium]|nr:hypothetical protein [Candidatus Daviesbacteria bacterium]
MLRCTNCGKRPRKISWSRHKKGSSGASEWPLRAQISKRLQKPNLHVFKGNKYCTKCLRIAKSSFKPVKKEEVTPVAA